MHQLKFWNTEPILHDFRGLRKMQIKIGEHDKIKLFCYKVHCTLKVV